MYVVVENVSEDNIAHEITVAAGMTYEQFCQSVRQSYSAELPTKLGTFSVTDIGTDTQISSTVAAAVVVCMQRVLH